MFSAFNELKYLNLEQNMITHIDENAFKQLSRLATLNLHSNQLKQIPSSALAVLPSLKLLDLSGQTVKLKEIEDFAFDRVIGSRTSLTIDLSKNHIGNFYIHIKTL